MNIFIKIGNLLQTPADAIVNPAHPSLLAGSGLCGQIHRAAGKSLEAAARKLGPIQYGEAVITPGFLLPQAWVIHAAPPKWLRETAAEKQQLAAAYSAALRCAAQHGLHHVAMPAMGIGINRFPPELAAQATALGVQQAGEACARLSLTLVLVSEALCQIYAQAFLQR
jgi:O-acetyl-ADP-ribose deacetylase